MPILSLVIRLIYTAGYYLSISTVSLLTLNWYEGYHKTKDGRTAKKGLYYYMNKRKKAGTSRKGKGTVSAKALKRSAKTAKS